MNIQTFALNHEKLYQGQLLGGALYSQKLLFTDPLLLKFLLFGNVLGIILPKIWDGDIYRIIYKVEYTIFRTCFTQKNFSG